MQDSVCMQVLYSEAHFNEELPNLALAQVFAHLALQVLTQVLVLAQLHHDVELVASLERIIEAHDEWIL